MTLGEALRQARLSKNLSRDELADLIGVSKSSIAAWERDNQHPSLKSVKNAENVLEAELQRYIEDTSPTRPYTNDTVFLCNKWHREGMQIKTIAKMLNRTEENIRRIIK